MGYPRIDGRRVLVAPLKARVSKCHFSEIEIDPDAPPLPASQAQTQRIHSIARRIQTARAQNAPVILAYGAHLVKNGLVPIVTRMMESACITHLATNGAGVIHDWEFAFHGFSEEDVKSHVSKGCFGTWDETGRHTALAVMTGNLDGLGYGESIGKMIIEDGYHIPSQEDLQKSLTNWSKHPKDNETIPARADLLQGILRHKIQPGNHSVQHKYKEHSITGNAYKLGIPLTVHPGIGYDIIYTHPLASGASYGRAGGIDFQIFTESVFNLDGGVFLSVGSSVMAPQIFEKAVSIVNNLRRQDKLGPLQPYIAVNDIIEENWDWTKGEPPVDNAAYYNRIGKSFSRMGGELVYTAADNRLFITNLCDNLNTKIKKL